MRDRVWWAETEDHYSRVMRLRLVRAGLLKIMQESDGEATETDADAVIRDYVVTRD